MVLYTVQSLGWTSPAIEHECWIYIRVTITISDDYYQQDMTHCFTLYTCTFR